MNVRSVILLFVGATTFLFNISIAAAQETDSTKQEFVYAGIPWHSSSVVVKAALSKRGFTFKSGFEGGEIYSGENGAYLLVFSGGFG
jgi:hypothetical protein